MYDDDEYEEYIPPIIERVQNIGGSAAAPGTGEFHKYKAIRRKEVLKKMNIELFLMRYLKSILEMMKT